MELPYATAPGIQHDAFKIPLSGELFMHAGTISALDRHHRFGLIDADDGRVLPFNQHALQQPIPQVLHVGDRVEFNAALIGEEARAVTVRLQSHGSTDFESPSDEP